MTAKDEDKRLILEAIKKADEDPCPLEMDLDDLVLLKKATAWKQKRLEFKKKPCEEWTNIDILSYLDFLFKEFGALRVYGSRVRDCDEINKLYDMFVKKIGARMNNLILRDYLDWWCSIWAVRFSGTNIYLRQLLQPHLIQRFLSRYEEAPRPVDLEDNSVEQLFDLGGLPLLVMEKGLVVAYHKIHAVSKTPFEDMRNTLQTFDANVLTGVIKRTIKNAPYSKPFDLERLIRPFIDQHKLEQFYNQNFNTLFGATYEK